MKRRHGFQTNNWQLAIKIIVFKRFEMTVSGKWDISNNFSKSRAASSGDCRREERREKTFFGAGTLVKEGGNYLSDHKSGSQVS